MVEATNVDMDHNTEHHDFFFKGCLGPEVGRSLWPSGVKLFGLFCVLNSNRCQHLTFMSCKKVFAFLNWERRSGSMGRCFPKLPL